MDQRNSLLNFKIMIYLQISYLSKSKTISKIRSNEGYLCVKWTHLLYLRCLCWLLPESSGE
jgi:hypothetical protein